MRSALAILLLGAGPLSPQEPEDTVDETGFDYGELDSTFQYGEGAEREAVVREPDFMESYQAFKDRLKRETGFGYMIEYAPILQYGAGEWHFEHELNVIGQWTAFEREDGAKGDLLAWYQNGTTLGGLNGSDFQAELGTLSPVNGGTPFANHNVLQLLAWEQVFARRRWRLMVGKLTTRILFNMNRYAISDREHFFTPMLVNNPVASYSARTGLGAYAQRREEGWSVSGMVRDADADSTGIDFDSLETGNWETVLEGALTPEIEGWGPGNYRLTWGYIDAIGADPSSWSLSFSADQDYGERLGLLLRYAWAEEPLRDFESRFAFGAQVRSPFAHPDDRLGFAYWLGNPSDSSLRDEHGLEAFYRLQLTQRVELTPDIQLIFDPALDTDEDYRAVLGLRLRIVL